MWTALQRLTGKKLSRVMSLGSQEGQRSQGSRDDQERPGEIRHTRTTRMIFMEEISEAGVQRSSGQSSRRCSETEGPAEGPVEGPAEGPVEGPVSENQPSLGSVPVTLNIDLAPEESDETTASPTHTTTISVEPAEDTDNLEDVVNQPKSPLDRPLTPKAPSRSPSPNLLAAHPASRNPGSPTPGSKPSSPAVSPSRSFKRTSAMVGKAMIAIRPTRVQFDLDDDPGVNNVASKPNNFRRTASSVGKAVIGTRGRAKSMHNAEELHTIEVCLLYETMKPLFSTMRISGLFFIRLKGHALFQRSRTFLKSVTNTQIYCTVLCLVLSANFVRSLWAFDPSEGFGMGLFFKLLWSMFWYETAFRSAFANYFWWRKKGGLQELFIAIENTCYNDGIIPYEHAIRATMAWVFGVCGVVSVSMVGVTSYGLFRNTDEMKELYKTILVPMPPSDSGTGIVDYSWKGVIILLMCLGSWVAVLSLAFFLMVCYIFYKEFEYLCRTFSMKIKQDGQFSDDLEKFRLKHQHRCKLVEQADQIFKFYIANCYVTNIPVMCLLMYNMLDATQTGGQRLMGGYWTVVLFFQMMAVSVAATVVNTQAHAPLTHIYSIRASNKSLEHQLEINMFLNKLTGTSIGLTAWDMFVIDKPAILTVWGMILTYFFLLLQFQNPLQEGADCKCALFDQNTEENITGLYVLE